MQSSNEKNEQMDAARGSLSAGVVRRGAWSGLSSGGTALLLIWATLAFIAYVAVRFHLIHIRAS